MLKGRILAVDFGLKRIGLAVSDPMFIIATALENLDAGHNVLQSAKALAAHLETLKKEKNYTIIEIVIGLPLHMNGQESDRSGLVREFATHVGEITQLPIHLFDERLSTVQADRALIETGFTRKKRAQVVDRVSAVIMLQTYLTKRGQPNV
ncbi:MAG: Holliday junction resolvase RuvX [Chlamydiales bacterium]|nr:Holliday junction resolvase RuvX [Chlamydiales bacterium]